MFHKKELLSLDYRMGPQDISMEDKKVSAVSEWPRPTSIKALQWFLGLGNFYNRFIWVIEIIQKIV